MNHVGLHRIASWRLLMIPACVLLLAACQDGSGPGLVTSPEGKPAHDGAKPPPPPPPPPADPAIVYHDDGLAVMNADGSNQTTIYTGPASLPAWSPDGQSVAYRDGGLWRIDVVVVGGVPTGTNRTCLVERDPVAFIGEPAWSPDGDQIAFTWFGPDAMRIMVVPADGGTPEVLYSSEFGAPNFPTWSRDGSQIAFEEGEAIRVYDIPSQQATTVLDAASVQQIGGNPMYLEWARTQDALVFQVGEGGTRGYNAVYIMELPDGTPDFVVGGTKRNRAATPCWSPDDAEILFAKDWSHLQKVDLATLTITDLGVSAAWAAPDWRRF